MSSELGEIEEAKEIYCLVGAKFEYIHILYLVI
jgi:hypothetical protein